MTTFWVLDEGHNPVPATVQEWGQLYVRNDARLVDYSEFHVAGRADMVWVSTVFLGLDHSWGHGPPVLFETMVFEGGRMGDPLAMRRYCTWDEAAAGHKEVVAELMARYVPAEGQAG